MPTIEKFTTYEHICNQAVLGAGRIQSVDLEWNTFGKRWVDKTASATAVLPREIFHCSQCGEKLEAPEES